MRGGTLWILLGLALALGALAWWQKDREERGAFDDDRLLFEGLVADDVTAIRVDHLERSLQLELQKDPDGTWRIVDPIAFPAEPAVLRLLFDAFALNRAVPAPDADPAKLRLDRPRVVLEVTEGRPAGERTRRVELGIHDLDGQHVFARVDGRIVKTLRNLDTTLDRDLADWRRRGIVELRPQQVAEVLRRGWLPPHQGGEPQDLELVAQRAGPLWRATRPHVATLDPGGMEYLLVAVCNLAARGFVEDDPANLDAYGFEAPDLTFELVTSAGASTRVLLKVETLNEAWLCRVEGDPHVYRVDWPLLMPALVPAQTMLDRRLLRVRREEIDALRLRHGGSERLMERIGQSWKLSEQGGSGASDQRGDAGRIADLLAELEQATFIRYEPGLEMPAQFVPVSIHVHALGEWFGGELGPPHTGADGVAGVLFQRDGDRLVALVEPRLLELAATPFEDLIERRVVALEETVVARIALRRGATRRVFLRDGRTGRWSPEGADTEARDFLELVDPLLSIRALRILAPGTELELDAPVEVEITDTAGEVQRYSIGRGRIVGGGEALGEGVLFRTAAGGSAVIPARLFELCEGFLR